MGKNNHCRVKERIELAILIVSLLTEIFSLVNEVLPLFNVALNYNNLKVANAK
ncbi:hypothetical protein LFREDSHE_22760 [Shewanella baltica]